MTTASEAFAPDRRLQLWMAVALALGTVSLLALVGVIVWLLAHLEVSLALVCAAAIAGILAVGLVVGRRKAGPRRRPAMEADGRRVADILERLAISADVPVPDTSIHDDAMVVSWTRANPLGSPRIHLTTGMLDAVEDRELAVVLAHELSHVVHRDALVMTILATPGVALLRGFRELGDTGPLLILVVLLAPFALVSAFAARLLSRHREVAADRGAALLVGSPAAVADTLRRLSRLNGDSGTDLRRAAGDVFHIVPLRPVGGIRRFWATHPTLERRVAELERLEARLQG